MSTLSLALRLSFQRPWLSLQCALPWCAWQLPLVLQLSLVLQLRLQERSLLERRLVQPVHRSERTLAVSERRTEQQR